MRWFKKIHYKFKTFFTKFYNTFICPKSKVMFSILQQLHTLCKDNKVFLIMWEKRKPFFIYSLVEKQNLSLGNQSFNIYLNIFFPERTSADSFFWGFLFFVSQKQLFVSIFQNLLSKIFHGLIIRLSQSDNTIITKR